MYIPIFIILSCFLLSPLGIIIIAVVLLTVIAIAAGVFIVLNSTNKSNTECKKVFLIVVYVEKILEIPSGISSIFF
jgi:hypothetical protein